MRQWIRRVLGHGPAKEPPRRDVIEDAARAACADAVQAGTPTRPPGDPQHEAAPVPAPEPSGATEPPPVEEPGRARIEAVDTSERSRLPELTQDEIALQQALDRARSEVADAELEL